MPRPFGTGSSIWLSLSEPIHPLALPLGGSLAVTFTMIFHSWTQRISSLSVELVMTTAWRGSSNAARARDILVLYDTDDLVFDPRLVHLIMHTLDVPKTEEEWDYWYAYTSRLGATMALCDGVLTSTPYLAEQVRMTCPSRPCAVIPNFLIGDKHRSPTCFSRESALTGSLGTGE